MSDQQKKAATREFNLKRRLLLATVSGVMSACFAYGLAAGDPIKELTVKHGSAPIWQGLPALVVVLLGGFTTNFIWCVILNSRNKTGYPCLSSEIRDAQTSSAGGASRAPMLSNSLFATLAGTTWYMQFFFYFHGPDADGTLQVFQLDAAHGQHHDLQHAMGPVLTEWKGSGLRTKAIVALSLAVPIGLMIIVGYGN